MDTELKILIIDDDEIDRMAIMRSLRKAGIAARFESADGITTAWEKINSGTYDCIFLDYLLPGGDGLQILREFRSEGHHTPVIVVTSQGDEKIAVEVMKSGGSDYISKRMVNPEGVSKVFRNAMRAHFFEEERRRTAQALRDSEARLAEAQLIANIGSWEVDLRTDERYWSHQVYRMLGYEISPKIALTDEMFASHLHPRYRKSTLESYMKLLREGEPLKTDLEVITTDGGTRHVEMQGKAERDEKGRIVKIAGTLQDITSRKQTERDLIEARDMAEESARTKEEFLANMSHEIRTPMNAIIGFTKLLYNTPLDQEQMEYLKAIDSSGEALLAIINDILDLSKIEAGMLSFEHRAFHLPELLTSLRGIFSAKATEKGLAINTFVGPDVPEWICGDRVRLNQVLINLVGNAMKFTEEGEISIEAKLLEETEQDVRILFEVADTGIGIPDEKQKTIFDSFTQASSDTTRKYGGTGLGLTICKRIVELQQGNLGLSSEAGEGSTFYFDLKFERGQAIEETIAAPKWNSSSEFDNRALRVLLAEDNRMNQKLATRILEKLGFLPTVVENGLEAIAAVERESFDVVLMDIQMPEMDGYAATAHLRAHKEPSIAGLPIIALTAHAMAEEVEKTQRAGMNGFVSKPFLPEDLKNEILAVVSSPRQLRTGASAEIEAPQPDTRTGTAPAQQKLLDLAGLEALAGDNISFKLELTDIYLEEAPRAVNKIEDALKAEDWTALYQAAHGIKPSFLLFGVLDAQQLFQKIEKVLKEEKNYEALQALVADLASRCTASVDELQAQRSIWAAGK